MPRSDPQLPDDGSIFQAGLTIRGVAMALACLVALSAAIATCGFAFTQYRHDTYVALRAETREVRVVQQALSDAHINLRALIDNTTASRENYNQSRRTLDAHAVRIAEIDRYLRGAGSLTQVRQGIDTLMNGWQDVLSLLAKNQTDQAQRAWELRGLDVIYSDTRDGLEKYWSGRTKVALETIQGDDLLKWSVMMFQVIAGLCSLAGIWIIQRMTTVQARDRNADRHASEVSHARMEQLFQMTDMLQSAAEFDDATAVLRATADELLPDLGGALYIFNDAHDRLVRSTVFGTAQESEFPESISPADCWALKRGKVHINLQKVGALCCGHHKSPHSVIEVPMTARGELIGVLHVFGKNTEAFEDLRQNDSIVVAIADSMSLALSNIILREKLRGEMLRDPLTRLYNRRYLDDTLQRLILLAQREQKKLAVIAIQLDNFQQFAAEHTQVINNALVREAATVVISLLRRSDFAARYEDDKIIVLLPECAMDNALMKGEQICRKLQELSNDFAARISASIGVAELSAKSADMQELLSAAIDAMFSANAAGGNCVARSEHTVQKTAVDDGTPNEADRVAAE